MSERLPPLRTIPIAGGVVDLSRREIRRGDQAWRLSPIEHGLLAWLAARPGEPQDVQTLLTQVWGYQSGVKSRTVGSTVHRLRRKLEQDPATPRHLVTVPGGRYCFDPLPETSAPAPVARPHGDFHGRGALLDRLSQAVRGGARLVTLHGAGGMGKTRMIQEWSRRVGDRFYDRRPIFVDWAAARTRARAVEVLAQAVDLQLTTETGSVQALGTHLAGLGPIAVILDNCEQLAPAAELVQAWLDQAPQLTLFTTSRRPLGLTGEQVLPVEGLAREPARALLLARAALVRPGWGRTATDEVDRLAERLDRLPLALELAAARARLLDPAGLLARLDHRLTLLRGPERTARHSSLAALLDWSWELLDPAAQRALCACGAFEGPFTVADIEGVTGDPGVVLALETLQDHALIRQRPQGDLALLETVRVHARARAAGAGEWPAWVHAHGQHVLARYRVAQGAKGDADRDLPAVLSLTAELLAVRDRALPDDPETAARATLALGHRYWVLGPLDTHLAQLEDLLARPLPPGTRREAQVASAAILSRLHRTRDAEALADRARRDAQDAGDVDTEVRACIQLANARLMGHRLADAAPVLARGLSLVGEHRAPWLAAHLLRLAGNLAVYEGRYADAERVYDEAVTLADRALGGHGRENPAGNRAVVLLRLGRPRQAEEIWHQVLAAHERHGFKVGQAYTWSYLCSAALESGRFALALERADQAHALHRETGDRIFGAGVDTLAAWALLALDRTDDAERRIRAGVQAHRTGAHAIYEAEALATLARVLVDQDRLDEAADALDRAAGLAADDPHQIAPLVAGTRATLAWRRREPGAGAALVAAASAYSPGEPRRRARVWRALAWADTPGDEARSALRRGLAQAGDPHLASLYRALCERPGEAVGPDTRLVLAR